MTCISELSLKCGEVEDFGFNGLRQMSLDAHAIKAIMERYDKDSENEASIWLPVLHRLSERKLKNVL
eukprot:UC4_evm1s727